MEEPRPDAAPESPAPAPARKSAAGVVAAGIFSSRILGFVRQSVVAYYFGVSAFTDVFEASLKGPNLLQNLLGEGTISAAFIPVYTRLLTEGRAQDAGRFAGAIFGLLLATAAGLVLLGIALAEPLVTLLTPGFIDDAAQVAAGTLPINRFDLTVQAVRIIFPMTGLLVLSAWALGVLNSHRRFFLPYVAPVLWNASIIGALIVGATLFRETSGDGLPTIESLRRLLFAAFYGALLGGALQFLVQLPLVLRVLRGFRFSLSTQVAGVREALRAFVPVVAGRGVYQFSGYLDVLLSSLLAAGALAALRPALMLYLLPVSLFGQSVAASELPELSRLQEADLARFLSRLRRSMAQTLFLTIPAMAGYLGLGFLIVGALFRRGAFGLADNWLVYVVLGGYSLGLVATTLSRLLQNAFYALQDTKTPAKIAVVRVVLSALVAVPLMFALDRFAVADVLAVAPGDAPLRFGAAGLALGATLGAWVELWRLHAALRRRISGFALPWGRIARMLGLAGLALAPAGLAWSALPAWPVALLALLVVGLFGGVYLGLAHRAGFPEMTAWTGRFMRRG